MGDTLRTASSSLPRRLRGLLCPQNFCITAHTQSYEIHFHNIKCCFTCELNIKLSAQGCKLVGRFALIFPTIDAIRFKFAILTPLPSRPCVRRVLCSVVVLLLHCCCCAGGRFWSTRYVPVVRFCCVVEGASDSSSQERMYQICNFEFSKSCGNLILEAQMQLSATWLRPKST